LGSKLGMRVGFLGKLQHPEKNYYPATIPILYVLQCLVEQQHTFKNLDLTSH